MPDEFDPYYKGLVREELKRYEEGMILWFCGIFMEI